MSRKRQAHGTGVVVRCPSVAPIADAALYNHRVPARPITDDHRLKKRQSSMNACGTVSLGAIGSTSCDCKALPHCLGGSASGSHVAMVEQHCVTQTASLAAAICEPLLVLRASVSRV